MPFAPLPLGSTDHISEHPPTTIFSAMFCACCAATPQDEIQMAPFTEIPSKEEGAVLKEQEAVVMSLPEAAVESPAEELKPEPEELKPEPIEKPPVEVGWFEFTTKAKKADGKLKCTVDARQPLRTMGCIAWSRAGFRDLIVSVMSRNRLGHTTLGSDSDGEGERDATLAMERLGAANVSPKPTNGGTAVLRALLSGNQWWNCCFAPQETLSEKYCIFRLIQPQSPLSKDVEIYDRVLKVNGQSGTAAELGKLMPRGCNRVGRQPGAWGHPERGGGGKPRL
eukprot:Skav224826  [mRNA]  locus=scaffold3408:9178:11425:+ [translate_table: standard]